MRRVPALRRLTGAATALAFALALVLPTLAQARVPARGPDGADICSAAAPGSPARQGGTPAPSHLPCCPLHAAHAAPPTAGARLDLRAGRPPLPLAALARPALRASPRAHTQPRAPPARA